MNLDRIIALSNDRTVYSDGEKCYKVFCNETPVSNVLCQAYKHALAWETFKAVPRLNEVELDGLKPALVFEYVHGKTLDRVMKESESSRSIQLRDFVDLQVQLHQNKCSRLETLNEKLNKKLSDSCLPNKHELLMLLNSMQRQEVFCHGDFVPSNVVKSENGSLVCIDWEDAFSGDKNADAAYSYILLKKSDADSAQDYLKLISSREGYSEAEIKKWIPLAAADKYIDANCSDREYFSSLAKITQDK